jgi:alpha,alpha-trehalase
MQENRYRAIHDYAIVGDCHSAALVSSDGSIDWACFPDFDSPAVFARLLDARCGGHFRVSAAVKSKAERHYLEATNVLRTTYRNEDGELAVTDLMPTHGPDGSRMAHYLVRILECTRGVARATVAFEPRFNYGESRARVARSKAGITARGPGGTLALEADFELAVDKGSASGEVTLREGEKRALVLRFSEGKAEFPGWDADAVMRSLEATCRHWRDWAGKCTYHGRHRDEVLRSALVLKLMIHEPTGGVIAAPTASLPEEVGGERNWDYRYVWLRDAAYVVQALWEIGHQDDAERFLRWITERTGAGERELGVVYRVSGERRIGERILDHLEGYRRSRPVRIGNAADEQHQLDVYGDVLLCADIVRRHSTDLETPHWERLRRIVDWVCEHWREPGKGIWEIRTESRAFVHSRVMAWVALDRGIAAAEELGLPADVERWKALREEIREDVMANGWSDELQSFVHAYGTRWLDAANLRLPFVGFLPATDPRMRATIERADEILAKEAFVYRYLEVDDGMAGGEGTFTLCSFWLVANLARLGRIEEAQRKFDQLVGCANDVGLFAEEIDPATREHLGNFPQALTHVGLISAAYALQDASRDQPK